MDRRSAMKSFAGIAALGVAGKSAAEVLTRHSVMDPALNADSLPTPVRQGGLAFFSAEEAATVAAVFDRLIPADELSIGASEAGCVVFLDRQLAGDYGKATSMYRRGPFVSGTPQQGPQLRQTPAERYRAGLAALEAHCRSAHGKRFAELDSAAQDQLLSRIEAGQVALGETDGEEFFALMVQNAREGYLSDPMYGGNKDMAGWKMIGFPGARYDYRDMVGKKGQALGLAPVSLLDRNA